jgi:hypothetical protein
MAGDFCMGALAFALGLVVAGLLTINASNDVMNGRIKAGYFDHEGKAYRVQEVTP